jgi:hypothetical protein
LQYLVVARTCLAEGTGFLAVGTVTDLKCLAEYLVDLPAASVRQVLADTDLLGPVVPGLVVADRPFSAGSQGAFLAVLVLLVLAGSDQSVLGQSEIRAVGTVPAFHDLAEILAVLGRSEILAVRTDLDHLAFLDHPASVPNPGYQTSLQLHQWQPHVCTAHPKCMSIRRRQQCLGH